MIDIYSSKGSISVVCAEPEASLKDGRFSAPEIALLPAQLARLAGIRLPFILNFQPVVLFLNRQSLIQIFISWVLGRPGLQLYVELPKNNTENGEKNSPLSVNRPAKRITISDGELGTRFSTVPRRG